MTAHEDYPHEAGTLYDCPACEEMYYTIIFMQGGEAGEVLDKLLNADGVVLQGATAESIAEAVDYLRQWDYGDESETDVRMTPWGSSDDYQEHDGYVIAWSWRMGYVSLSRKVLGR